MTSPNGNCVPVVIVRDEALALSEHVLRPYGPTRIGIQQRICNYVLTRARQMVECAFGILTNKWSIFNRPLNVTPQLRSTLVRACYILGIFVRRNDGFELEDILCESNFESIQQGQEETPLENT
jgi:hypothetical protein